jgi:hypothetical protein
MTGLLGDENQFIETQKTSTLLQTSEEAKAISPSHPPEEEVTLPTAIASAPNSSQKKVGRPPGRRSNPDVDTLNLLIDKDLVAEVRFNH